MNSGDPQPSRLRGALRRGRDKWADLWPRVLSGAALAVVGLVLLISTGIWIRFGAALVVGLMMWELARLTGWRHPEFHSPRHPVLIGILSGLVMLAMLVLPGDWPLTLVLVPMIAGWHGTHEHERPAYLMFTLAIFGAGYALVVIREVMGLPTLAWIVGTVVLSDVLGYFVGRRIGGPRFWPAISPKKTWSGTVAGWLGAFVLALILMIVGQASWPVVILGPLLAVAGQFGDIAESWLKRRVGVKDSSDLIPGHGGFMDRFDAMSGSLLVALLLLIANLLPVIGG
ncbi:phosphatidate cytidylyltransferase [Paracoccus kondratievae]|uniref:phosphatidate cytidylyltransferase n=1 Tax=Paracoccus kondratievae TaxID=135740 RepID=UPI0012660CD5|nr:phosphatidate cytidylyltransferase [Paracoccus kondratievae]QFQ86868.1 phosphatidate cytidylyltransferase [Paracoccus kondratievae]